MTNQLQPHEQQELATYEQTINQGLEIFYDVGEALLSVRDKRLYRQAYTTFEDYCSRRWNMTRSRAYQLIDASILKGNLSTIVDKMPANESQARELAGLAPDDQIGVWNEALDTAPNGKVTARHIEQTKQNYWTKNRQSYSSGSQKDDCQSPPYAILPLLPFIDPDWIIWEPAAGEGYLVRAMQAHGLHVIDSDIKTNQDFYTWQPGYWDVSITNPPWSEPAKWMAHCYTLGKPWALLLKTEVASNVRIQELQRNFGRMEHIYCNARIDYKMPHKGWSAKGSFVNSHWYTWGFDIGRETTLLSDIREAKRIFKDKMGLY